EGLVHTSELAQHHVENPREVVSQGDVVTVKVIEVDGERRRLSLSLKRVEPGETVRPRPDGVELVRPKIDLSEDVFSEAPAALEGDTAVEEEAAAEPEAEAEPQGEAAPELEPEAEADLEPEAEADLEPEAEADLEAEALADAEAPAEAEQPVE